ncbi:MAG: hypothetical protein MUF01_01320 [Bryobacterales bacterium]|jgi:Rod binding domain-containing protein|nr:hypothetical protein [Bryobacterales bacterium]
MTTHLQPTVAIAGSALDTPSRVRSAPLMDADALRQVDDAREQAFQVARQFESLLIEEVIKSARMAGGGWLGEDADSTSESVAEMGEQFLARALTAGGGMGLAAQFAPVILRDMQQAGSASTATPTAPTAISPVR